jgi:23S rRNA pseudouridine1911/1915/1917 synthase
VNDHRLEPGPEVLYLDNHLLALNKPCGIPTQPGGASNGSMEESAREFIRLTRGKPGNVFLHAVHRLDRVASGITLFSLTGKSLSRMNDLMRTNRTTRIYHAVITGKLPCEQGRLENFLRHSRLRSVLSEETHPGAKKAVLRYRLLAREGRLSLVEVELETGRYHQIRAQLSAIGCPILGDSLYGSDAPYVRNGIALHHRRMEFIHPVRGELISIEAPYPEAWPVHPRDGRRA